MKRKMFKNNKQISINWGISYKGNWNYKFPQETKVYGKPIAVINIDGDKFVWKHEEIFELIKAYHKADIESIEKIISNQNTGIIKNYETPFIIKLEKFLSELKGGQK